MFMFEIRACDNTPSLSLSVTNSFTLDKNMSFLLKILIILLSLIMSELSPLIPAHRQPSRRLKYRFQLIKSRAAVLVLIWDILLGIFYLEYINNAYFILL